MEARCVSVTERIGAELKLPGFLVCLSAEFAEGAGGGGIGAERRQRHGSVAKKKSGVESRVYLAHSTVMAMMKYDYG